MILTVTPPVFDPRLTLHRKTASNASNTGTDPSSVSSLWGINCKLLQPAVAARLSFASV